MTTTTMISSFALMAFLDTILPPPSLPACVSLAFETRAFASNRRETVRTNINYNPYLNPHPPKRAYPLCKRISLPSPSFSKVNTYIRNLPSPEFHRDEFRYASAFIRKIYLLPSILPKKRKRSSKRNEEESRFFLSFFQNREIREMNYSNIVGYKFFAADHARILRGTDAQVGLPFGGRGEISWTFDSIKRAVPLKLVNGSGFAISLSLSLSVRCVLPLAHRIQSTLLTFLLARPSPLPRPATSLFLALFQAALIHLSAVIIYIYIYIYTYTRILT